MENRGRELAEKFLPALEAVVGRAVEPNEENFGWYCWKMIGMMDGIRVDPVEKARIIAASPKPVFLSNYGRSDEFGRAGISYETTGEDCLRILLVGAVVREMFEVVKEREAIPA